MKIVAQTTGLITLLFLSLLANAADYSSYASDIFLLESKQAKKQGDVVQYADPENGPLLKSVLSPQRASGMLSAYFLDVRNGVQPEYQLPALLKPLISRYEKSFIANPRAYEAEFLDTLEIFKLLLGHSPTLIKLNLQRTNPDNNKTAPSDKKVAEKLNDLVGTVAQFSTKVNQLSANDIRSKVDRGIFSAEGAKRALAIADEINPPAKLASISYDDMAPEQKVAMGKRVFQSHCAACHGNNGMGVPALFPSLIESDRLKSDQGIANIIVRGTKESSKGIAMPPVGGYLSTAEITAVINYTRSAFLKVPSDLISEKVVAEAIVSKPGKE